MSSSFLKKRQNLLEKLKEHELRLSSKRGQNFLIDQGMQEKLSKIIPHSPCILEIGPGLGHLTQYLEQKTPRLLSIELDAGFIPILRKTFPHIEVLHQDFLGFSPTTCSPPITGKWICVGNLPYYISTKILEHLLDFPHLPESLYIMLEKDFVKEKLLNPQSSMGAQISFFYQLKRSLSVPRESFFPRPTKESRFLELQKIRERDETNRFYPLFISLLFKKKKKPLHKALFLLSPEILSIDELSPFLSLRVHQIETKRLWDIYERIMQFDKDVFQRFHYPHEP